MTSAPMNGSQDARGARYRLLFWGFVVFGCLLRVLVYGLRFPWWHDESALAANFIDRSFADFPRTLDYGQVAPLLFLWGEVAAIWAWGFHEYSLRALPLVCGVAGMLLFARLAARTLDRSAALFAVAALAVSYYPIRHSAEVKPYAGDLCVAACLLLIARPLFDPSSPNARRTALFSLALAAPLALGMSFPAVFVLGGVLLAAAPVWRANAERSRLAIWLAYLAAVLSTTASFWAYLKLGVGDQYSDHRAAMVEHWGDAFPPLQNPTAFVAWLAQAASGVIFAYPLGGKNGCSAATAILFAIGLFAWMRGGRRPWAWLALCVFGLAFVAAALERYPLGGHARVVQYLGPLVLLAVGAGASAVLHRLRSEVSRRSARVAALAGLAVCGLVIGGRALAKPYSRIEDRQSREFARWLWREKLPTDEIVCAERQLARAYPWALGFDFHQTRCFRRMFLPPNTVVRTPEATAPPSSERTAYVVFVWNPNPDRERCVEKWLTSMKSSADVRRAETFRVNPGAGIYDGEYRLYWFAPKRTAGKSDDDPKKRR
jgi:4-amino-4-deoxy-L-arabinose transferase-like glycosyltransferase